MNNKSNVDNSLLLALLWVTLFLFQNLLILLNKIMWKKIIKIINDNQRNRSSFMTKQEIVNFKDIRLRHREVHSRRTCTMGLWNLQDNLRTAFVPLDIPNLICMGNTFWANNHRCQLSDWLIGNNNNLVDSRMILHKHDWENKIAKTNKY